MPELFDLVLRNGEVVFDDATASVDVAIKDGTVVALLSPGEAPASGRQEIDVAGKLVMPGGIDAHVHFGMRFKTGLSQSPDSGTVAAVCGGTTTVLDFTVPEPGESSIAALDRWQERFTSHSAADFGFHVMPLGASVTSSFLDEIPAIIDYGSPSVKTRQIDAEWAIDDGRYLGLLEQLGAHGGISVIHAEDQAIVDFTRSRLMQSGKTEWYHAAEARPSVAEDAGIRRAIFLAEHTRTGLYILHMAAKEGVWDVREARSRGLPVYGETCHCYLCFTTADLRRPDGVLYNNHPTLKYEEDRDELWTALARGWISTVATDDYTTEKAVKIGQGVTLANMRGGHNGVETRLMILFSDGVAKGRITASDMVRVASTNPAKIFGLYPAKGTICAGSDADIVVFDPDVRKILRLEDLHAASDYSVYEGWQLQGYPVLTLLRGKVVAENGAYKGSLSDGRFIKRVVDPSVLQRPI